MLKNKRVWPTALLAGLSMLIATPAFARSISFKDAGAALWIFVVIGAVIVLLQLIPAAILFFSFIGTSSNMVFNRRRGAEARGSEGRPVLPGVEPATAKK